MKIKQTAATKIRSTNLGIAARAAKILRQHFDNRLPFPKNGFMQCHFVGAIINWLGNNDAASLPPEDNLGYINGFAFNAAASVAALWKVPLQITKENDGLLRMYIPAFIPAEKLLVPPGTVETRCTIVAASWNWLQPNLQNNAGHRLLIPFTGNLFPAQDIPLAVPASRGCLLVTIVSLEFIQKDGERDNRVRYLPCNVMDARYC